MSARWFLLDIADEHQVLGQDVPYAAVLFLDDEKRKRFQRWKDIYTEAQAKEPLLSTLEVIDEMSIEWFSKVDFTGTYTRENDKDTILTQLQGDLALEFSNGELGLLGKKMSVELERAVVSDDGIFWTCHAGAEIGTAATLSWEELLEDKPLGPH